MPVTTDPPTGKIEVSKKELALKERRNAKWLKLHHVGPQNVTNSPAWPKSQLSGGTKRQRGLRHDKPLLPRRGGAV
jgi:hypothetical protein